MDKFQHFDVKGEWGLPEAEDHDGSPKIELILQKYEPRKIPDTQKISPVIRENRPGFSVPF